MAEGLKLAVIGVAVALGALLLGSCVSSGTYESLQLGARRWLRYRKGGYWGLRYGEQFLTAKPDGEQPQDWSVR